MFDQAALLRSALETLPWWVGFGRLGFVLLAALSAYLCSALALRLALGPLRRLPPEAHWSERARHLFPVRVTMRTVPVLVALGLGLYPAMDLFYRRPFSQVGSGTLAGLCFAAAFVAALSCNLGTERRMGSTMGLGARLRTMLMGMLLLWPHAILGVSALSLLLLEAPIGLAYCALFVALTQLAVRGGNLKLSRALGLIQPADERLNAAVARSAARMGMATPRTWLMAHPMINAFAFVHTRELAFTDRTVATMSDAELEALAAHELAHLSEPSRVRMARAAISTTWVLLVLPPLLAKLWGQDYRIAYGVGLVLGLVLTRLYNRLSRRMEERADALAVAHEPEPGLYVRTLERLHELNLLPVVTGPSTHPSAYDRFVASGAAPSYPRPLPPARPLLFGALMLGFVPSYLAWPAVERGLSTVLSSPTMALAVTGNSFDLERVADARWERGDREGALTLYRAGSMLWPDSDWWPSSTAQFAAAMGRCDEAASWVEMTRKRARGADDAQRVANAESSLAGCRATAQGNLGFARWKAGDLAGALPHYREAERLEATSLHWASEVARILTGLGRCDEARAQLDETERRLGPAALNEAFTRARSDLAACQTWASLRAAQAL